MNEDLEAIGIDMLILGIHRRYGYDFSNYARASFVRRVRHAIVHFKSKTVFDLMSTLMQEPLHFEAFLQEVSITVTEMFRDPLFYKAMRTLIVPHLKTFPSLRIWHAGCSTGEEVYSTAIVSAEEDLKKRTTVYATDINEAALKKARTGIYAIERIREVSASYLEAGGLGSFSDYYHAKYESVVIRSELKSNITFSTHNLVCDASFGSMTLIICRNVLIYFDKPLQNRVLKLFRDSLQVSGILCLGSKESLKFSEVEKDFEVIDPVWKIFRLKGAVG